MHASTLNFINIARRHLAVGVQVTQAFNQEQAKLQIERVLVQEHLSTVAGTQRSLATLGQLRQLMTASKEAFGKMVLTSSRDFAQALAEMPIKEQQERQAGLVSSINWQLAAQASFYANRERWIDAAEAICHLIDSRRNTITFGEEGAVFSSDEDLTHFEELLAVIDEVHQLEVAGIQERMARLSRALTLLGMAPSA
ncbi:hypothetical protein H010_06625 [Hydrogenophaga taeniospiralis CCUG 15921]|uniref:Uncharacterized protein n=1 Tax=Hydrogenophaga taeniospiralis CCUG 15921 TaxID=1281780 RepID=A0A9X4NPS9_9BURK|nr:hypothetical protein [Hydrogenophaga taeniospiralis]MDG5974922.1 hypothetical protein [Hydrogenophaga taeniospiralis CCUG 15921]